MNLSLPKPVVIALLVVAVLLLGALAWMYMRTGSGELSGKTIKPVKFSPPGGVDIAKARGATAPAGGGQN